LERAFFLEEVAMSLKKAVYQILIEHSGCLMPIEEVCRQNEEQDLFKKRKDGSYPDAPYILYGVKNCLTQFEVFIRLRR
jgi:hypothetical protein